MRTHVRTKRSWRVTPISDPRGQCQMTGGQRETMGGKLVPRCGAQPSGPQVASSPDQNRSAHDVLRGWGWAGESDQQFDKRYHERTFTESFTATNIKTDKPAREHKHFKHCLPIRLLSDETEKQWREETCIHKHEKRKHPLI